VNISHLDITAQLSARPARTAAYEAEAGAMLLLAGELERAEGDVLGRLAQVALELCRAQSAGISILEADGTRQIFRWHAIRGAWAHFEGQGLPRDASPCGITVARGQTFLMEQPGLVFPEVAKASPPIAEVLLTPFRILGETVGTVWVIAHDESVRFDAEDARLVERLARFASTAFLLREQVSHAMEVRDQVFRSNRRLVKIVEELRAERGNAVAGSEPAEA
jgi:GAF domain-containing protein